MSAAAASLLLAAPAPATAAAAAAAACAYPGWGPYDTGHSYTVSGKTSPLRYGPYAGCDTKKTLPAGTEVDIDCYYYNPGSGHLWYHVDAFASGGWYSGWIYSGNLGLVYESNQRPC